MAVAVAVAMETAKRLGTKTSMASAIAAKQAAERAEQLYKMGGDTWDTIKKYIAEAMKNARSTSSGPGATPTGTPEPPPISSLGPPEPSSESAPPSSESAPEPSSESAPEPSSENNELIVPEYCKKELSKHSQNTISTLNKYKKINNDNFQNWITHAAEINLCIQKNDKNYQNNDIYKHHLSIIEKIEEKGYYANNNDITRDDIKKYNYCLTNETYNLPLEKGIDGCSSQNIDINKIPYCFGNDDDTRNKNIRKWRLFTHPDKNKNCQSESNEKFVRFTENSEKEKSILSNRKTGGKKTLKRKPKYLKKRKNSSLKKH